MRVRNKNGLWIKKKLPTNHTYQSYKNAYFDDDLLHHRNGKVQVISVREKIISKQEHVTDGSRILTGFVDIEKIIRVKDGCGETRVIFLEKILPFQILELELDRECHEEE